MIKRFLGVLFITGIISIPSLARTVVYGRVTGTNGKPIPVANVFLCHPGNNHPVKSFTVRKDGDYKAIIPTPGIWLLRFTGIFHREYPIAIYAVNGSRSRLDVSLRTYNYGGVFTPAVIGNFSGWSVSKEVPFQKGPDGVYFATVPCKSDTLVYRLLNVRSGGEVEGTDADGFIPNGTENYNSFLIADRREVRIEFDPNRLPYSKKTTTFKFANSSSLEARFARAYAGFEDAKQDSRESFFKSVVDHRMMGHKFDYDPYLSRVESMLHREHSGLVRQALELSYFSISYISTNGDYVKPNLCQLLLTSIPPASPVWSLRPSSISEAIDFSGYPMYKRMDYIREVLNDNPVSQTKITLLANRILIMSRSLNPGEMIPYLSMLVDQYGDSPEAVADAKAYSQYLQPKDGKPAPQFSINSYPDTSSHITNDLFKGKYCLLDFWSPSDRSSIVETRHLQRLQENLGDERIAMVSVALNFPSKVRKKHVMSEKMLRYSAEVQHGFNNKICEDYEVYSLPKLVLIGHTGNVVASGWELHGSKLDTLLRSLR